MQLHDLILRQQARWKFSVVLILLVLLVACFFSLAVGEIFIWPWSPDGGLEQQLLLQLRMPRLLAALAIGASLAASGAVLQVLLGNPLAEPRCTWNFRWCQPCLGYSVICLAVCPQSNDNHASRNAWGIVFYADPCWFVPPTQSVNGQTAADRCCAGDPLRGSRDVGVLFQ